MIDFRKLSAALALALATAAPVAAAPPSTATKFTLNGVEFLHRWSMNNQNEYTPRGQEDLAAWTTMVTLTPSDVTRDATVLAELAAAVRTQYEKGGATLLVKQDPEDLGEEADADSQYFQAALFTTDKFMEAAMTRVSLVKGRGLIVTYSQRMYGNAVGPEMSKWLKVNGPKIQDALLAWDVEPTLADLKALPQAKE